MDKETAKLLIAEYQKIAVEVSFRKRSYMIITKAEEDTITEQGINIEVIPAWKWLCLS